MIKSLIEICEAELLLFDKRQKQNSGRKSWIDFKSEIQGQILSLFSEYFWYLWIFLLMVSQFWGLIKNIPPTSTFSEFKKGRAFLRLWTNLFFCLKTVDFPISIAQQKGSKKSDEIGKHLEDLGGTGSKYTSWLLITNHITFRFLAKPMDWFEAMKHVKIVGPGWLRLIQRKKTIRLS